MAQPLGPKGQIYKGIFVLLNVGRIASKHIKDLTTVVLARWHPTITVVVTLSARPCQALHFIAFRPVDQCEIRVCVSASPVVT